MVNATEAGVQQQTVTIVDDDTAFVVLSVSTGSIAEGSGVSVVTVSTLSGVTSTTGIVVTLTYAGTALSGVDYSGSIITVTIPAGLTGVSFSLSGLQDLIVE